MKIYFKNKSLNTCVLYNRLLPLIQQTQTVMKTYRLQINTVEKTIGIQEKVDNGSWNDVERLQYDPNRYQPNFGPSNFEVLHGYMRDRKRIYTSGELDKLTEAIL